MRERILAEGTPPPCFCVSAGIIGLTGERTVSAGIVGLSGEQELFKVKSWKSKVEDKTRINAEITEGAEFAEEEKAEETAEETDGLTTEDPENTEEEDAEE